MALIRINRTSTRSQALAGGNNNKLYLPTDANSLIMGGKEFGVVYETITYSALVTRRNNSTLIPGVWYRITDYVTTTAQADTQSAGHAFDIIVLALSPNTLCEDAYAIQHQGDTYFANSKLSAWRLKYCLDNDTNRFAWADDTNGKGVIWYMKDEWDNECPYDFKNIMFKRYKITDFTSCPSLRNTYLAYKESDISYLTGATVDLNDYKYVFTFNYNGDNSNSGYCINNTIANAVSFQKKILLNNIVFLNSSGYSMCQNNTFSANCQNNTFSANCQNNTFGVDCQRNTFGNYVRYNIFGDITQRIIFGKYCQYNTFDNGVQSVTFGDYATYNVFGKYCQYITFGKYCQYNTFGSSCLDIVFGSSSSNLKSYCRYIQVEAGNKKINLTCSATTSSSKYFQNVKIAAGVNNSNTTKTITHTTASDTFQTIYQPVNSVTVSV